VDIWLKLKYRRETDKRGFGNDNSQTKRGNHQRLLVSHGNCCHDCHWEHSVVMVTNKRD